jgi:hypothetical protein
MSRFAGFTDLELNALYSALQDAARGGFDNPDDKDYDAALDSLADEVLEETRKREE